MFLAQKSYMLYISVPVGLYTACLIKNLFKNQQICFLNLNNDSTWGKLTAQHAGDQTQPAFATVPGHLRSTQPRKLSIIKDKTCPKFWHISYQYVPSDLTE